MNILDAIPGDVVVYGKTICDYVLGKNIKEVHLLFDSKDAANRFKSNLELEYQNVIEYNLFDGIKIVADTSDNDSHIFNIAHKDEHLHTTYNVSSLYGRVVIHKGMPVIDIIDSFIIGSVIHGFEKKKIINYIKDRKAYECFDSSITAIQKAEFKAEIEKDFVTEKWVDIKYNKKTISDMVNEVSYRNISDSVSLESKQNLFYQPYLQNFEEVLKACEKAGMLDGDFAYSDIVIKDAYLRFCYSDRTDKSKEAFIDFMIVQEEQEEQEEEEEEVKPSFTDKVKNNFVAGVYQGLSRSVIENLRTQIVKLVKNHPNGLALKSLIMSDIGFILISFAAGAGISFLPEDFKGSKHIENIADKCMENACANGVENILGVVVEVVQSVLSSAITEANLKQFQIQNTAQDISDADDNVEESFASMSEEMVNGKQSIN